MLVFVVVVVVDALQLCEIHTVNGCNFNTNGSAEMNDQIQNKVNLNLRQEDFPFG